MSLTLISEVAPPEIREDLSAALPQSWYEHTDDTIVSSCRAIAFVEGEPVGVIWYRPFGAKAIAGVFVAPEFRDAGTARKLVEFALHEMSCAATDLESTLVVTVAGAALMRSFGARVHGPSA